MTVYYCVLPIHVQFLTVLGCTFMKNPFCLNCLPWAARTEIKGEWGSTETFPPAWSISEGNKSIYIIEEHLIALQKSSTVVKRTWRISNEPAIRSLFFQDFFPWKLQEKWRIWRKISSLVWKVVSSRSTHFSCSQRKSVLWFARRSWGSPCHLFRVWQKWKRQREAVHRNYTMKEWVCIICGFCTQYSHMRKEAEQILRRRS